MLTQRHFWLLGPDDELHNINLSENTKTAEALALKKKGNQAGQYTGYDDDEFTDKGKAGVLAKYDDDITGADDGGFRLGAAPPPPTKGKGKGKGRAQAEDDEPEREKIQLSMDYAKGFHNDYLQEGEVGFKIKKKKKRAPARVTEASTEAHQEGMDLDGGAGGAIERQNLDETNLIDDDDLQASLARARREQNRKKVLELKANAAKAGSSSNGAGMEVDQVKTEHSPDDELYPSGSRTGGDDDVLVMDDTSEFVRNIQLAAARPTAAPTNGVKRNASPVPLPAHRGVLSALQSGHHSIQPRIKAEEVDVPISEMTAEFGSPREEGEYEEDATMGDGYGDLPGADDDEAEAQVKPKVDPDELGTTAGEKLVSGGMAATLGLLRNQGLIKERTAEEIVRDRTQKEREAWLAEQRNRERQREEERLASRAAGSAISQEQREYENRMREQRDAQIALEAFKDYKPNVNITYHDEFGRNQTMKEAYKQLSHTFHGKGSGAKKTEKRLKKIEEERKQAAMVSGDTPLSSASAFAARAERMGSATMVLSVGNRGTAPVQDEILNNLKKPDLKGKGKAKPIAATALPGRAGVIDDIPLRPLPLPEAGDVGRGASPATASAGFAPVRSFTPIGQEGGDRAAVETGKRGFTSGGFVPIAVKRKAEEELSR